MNKAFRKFFYKIIIYKLENIINFNKKLIINDENADFSFIRNINLIFYKNKFINLK